MDDLEQLQEILREDPAPTPTPRHIRPELIMGILAGVLAVLVFGIYGPGYNASSFVYMAY